MNGFVYVTPDLIRGPFRPLPHPEKKWIPGSVQGCNLMSWERMDARNDQARGDRGILAIELGGQHGDAFALHFQLSFQFTIAGSERALINRINQFLFAQLHAFYL